MTLYEQLKQARSELVYELGFLRG